MKYLAKNICFSLLASLVVAALLVGAPAEAAAVTGLDLNGRAGLFVSERTGEPLRLVVNKGELRIPGARAALIPVTKDRFRNPPGDLFFMSQDEFDLNFLS